MIDPNTPPDGTIRDWIDDRAKRGGTAFVFPADRGLLTWHALRNAAISVARDLTLQGCQKGESVAILQPNGRDAVIAFYGALYGGFRATMVNLAAGPDAISYALDHSDARFAFVHTDAEEVYIQAKPDGMERLKFIDVEENVQLHDVSANDDALLMYTSGTTGRPKGVIHTHASLLAGGWTTAVAHKLTAADRGFCVLPIYHINGLCVTVMGSLVSGGSLSMVPKFSASRFWDQVGSSAATWFSVVPTIISHLVHGDFEPSPDVKAKIRFGRSASAPLAPEVQTAFENRFDVPIVETMGLTETAAQILSNPLPPGERKIGSPGIPFGNEISILSPTGEELGPGQEGEIAVRGPNVLKEYLKNPEATSKTFNQDGWLLTGDLGQIDDDGYVFVTGRLKELIIKGGENIAPREVDEALYQHADVVEAGAFARPCDKYGERVEAAVRLTVGSAATEDELIKICHDRLGAFKSPDVIHLMSELPKGPSGKIQRLKLADLLP